MSKAKGKRQRAKGLPTRATTASAISVFTFCLLPFALYLPAHAGTLRTRPLSEAVLPGCTRAALREELAGSGIPFEEAAFFVARLSQEGMPLAVTGLTDQQYQTLQRWLASGAPIDEQGLAPSAKEALQIVQWENLLNAPGARQSLVGRWLFEHWFLAHVYFKDGEPGHFFQASSVEFPSSLSDTFPSTNGSA